MSIPLLDAADSKHFWFGPQASTVSGEIDWLFDFIMWISAVFFVVIIGVGAYFAWKYRRRPGHDSEPSPAHNTPLELVWSIVPTILVATMFWFGFEIYMDVRQVPRNTYDINVTASQWNWSFEYPGGVITDELHVPKGQKVRLIMTSNDVIHSMWIPDFRTKMDCVPGRFSEIWFEAPKEGEHWLWCTEYCGIEHSNMGKKVQVHSREGFAEWFKREADVFDGGNRPLADAGELLYVKRGCAGCHSLDGEKMTGPSFLWSASGVAFGEPRGVSDGSDPKFDEEYIRNSIRNPGAVYVNGFGVGMPAYPENATMTDKHIQAIIAFLKRHNGVGQGQ